jgi:replicative superfamily II helicase
MEPQDVHQAIGRAGRLGYSEKGDARIFIPSTDLHAEGQRIFGSYEVRSTLNDVNVMMFHILAYIDNGHIKTAQQLYDWHDRTLASVQKKRLGVEVFTLKTAQNVLENLEMRKMIKKDEKNEYSTTEIGQVTARMYMSPLDVSDWFKNFSKVKQLNPKKGQETSDKNIVNAITAMAFANCYSWARGGNCYISKNEQRAKSVWDLATVLQRNKIMSISNLRDVPCIKYGAIFYSLLSGNSKIDPQLQSIYSSLRQDFSRIISTMKQIDMRYGSYYKKSQADCHGYGWGEEWSYLMFRLVYPGISPALWNLVSVDGIGQVYAEKLFKAGIKDKANLMAESNREKLEEILGKKRSINVLESMGVHSDPSAMVVSKARKPKAISGVKINKTKNTKGLLTTKDLF